MDNSRIYDLDIEKIKKDFKFKDEDKIEHGKVNLKHEPNKTIKLFPFVANDKTLVSNFGGVIGEFTRIACDKVLKGEFDVNEFIENVVEEIEQFEGDNSEKSFKSIIKSMFIHNDKLVDFDLKTMNYIVSNNSEEKYARFLFSIFMDEELKNIIKNLYNKETHNILNKLVLGALPELEEKNIEIEDYKCYLPFIKQVFKKDLLFLMNDEELYRNSIQRFLEFYNMFYLSQVCIKLSKFEKAEIDQIETVYYTLSWESTSKNRTAYSYGYKNFKSPMNSIFSHVITLELLNHHNLNGQLGYAELYDLFNENDIEKIADQIDALIEEYKKYVCDVEWNNFVPVSKNSGNKAFDKVYELFQVIEYQFDQSSRNRAYEAYKNWFKRFVEERFGKRRGSLGYNLNLSEEDIILLTKICINNNEKLKVSSLFNEFEKRGISFDRDSKVKIIGLYEKLNLLEKKSDSGDAQYVRSVL